CYVHAWHDVKWILWLAGSFEWPDRIAGTESTASKGTENCGWVARAAWFRMTPFAHPKDAVGGLRECCRAVLALRFGVSVNFVDAGIYDSRALVRVVDVVDRRDPLVQPHRKEGRHRGRAFLSRSLLRQRDPAVCTDTPLLRTNAALALWRCDELDIG